ncbi:MAG: glycosyltransferase family 39 protein [Candidatus Omnitrophota bacterium]
MNKILSLLFRPKFALCLLLALHGSLMASFYEPACAGADANGYLAQAQYIVNLGSSAYRAESSLQFSGPHWRTLGDGRIISRYPPGLPLLLSPLYWLGGPPWMLAFNPLLTTLTLAGLFALVRLWADELWAVLAVAVMAVNPVANVWTFQSDAHPAIAFFLVWGLFFLALWSKSDKPGWIFLVGLLLGMIPALHYAEAVFAPAIALFVLMHWKNERRFYAAFLLAILGALIPAALMGWHNCLVFGSVLITGYESSGNFSLFGWKYFFQKALYYPLLATFAGLGPFFPLGLWGMFQMARSSEARKEGILLLGLALPLMILYMAYFFPDPSLRFLMPTFYLYAAAAARLGMQYSTRQWKYGKKIVIALMVLNTIAGLAMTILFLLPQKHMHKQLANITSAIEERVEADAIVIAPMIVNQYLESFGKWKLAEESYFTGKSPIPEAPPSGEQGPGPGLDLEAMHSLFSFDEKAKNMEHYRNESGKGLSEVLLRDLDRWAANKHSIYWIGDKDAILALIPENDRANIVCEIDIGIHPPPGAPRREPREARGADPQRRRDRGPGMVGPLGMLPGMAGGGQAAIVKWERSQSGE